MENSQETPEKSSKENTPRKDSPSISVLNLNNVPPMTNSKIKKKESYQDLSSLGNLSHTSSKNENGPKTPTSIQSSR